MPEAMMLSASVRIPLADPKVMLGKLCEYFVKHGTVTLSAAEERIQSASGIAVLETESEALILKAECPDDVMFSIVKPARQSTLPCSQITKASVSPGQAIMKRIRRSRISM